MGMKFGFLLLFKAILELINLKSRKNTNFLESP